MDVTRAREALRRRTEAHREAVWGEVERLTGAAVALGAQRVVLFGSLVRERPGLTTDVDLLIVWDTLLDFVARTAEVYRRLQPRRAADLLVYTPEEMAMLADRAFVRRALEEGSVLYEE